MSTEEVLDAIDAACADWEVGPDAARFNADPEKTSGAQWHMSSGDTLTFRPGAVSIDPRRDGPLDMVVWFAPVGADGQPGEWTQIGTIDTRGLDVSHYDHNAESGFRRRFLDFINGGGPIVFQSGPDA